MKEISVFTARWMGKEDVPYKHSGMILDQKKGWNNVCSNMDGPRYYHTEWSKSDREKQVWYGIIYM